MVNDEIAKNARLQAEIVALRPWAEVGKRMQWTRITDDPATWPPDNGPVLMHTPDVLGTWNGPYWLYFESGVYPYTVVVCTW